MLFHTIILPFSGWSSSFPTATKVFKAIIDRSAYTCEPILEGDNYTERFAVGEVVGIWNTYVPLIVP